MAMEKWRWVRMMNFVYLLFAAARTGVYVWERPLRLKKWLDCAHVGTSNCKKIDVKLRVWQILETKLLKKTTAAILAIWMSFGCLPQVYMDVFVSLIFQDVFVIKDTIYHSIYILYSVVVTPENTCIYLYILFKDEQIKTSESWCYMSIDFHYGEMAMEIL